MTARAQHAPGAAHRYQAVVPAAVPRHPGMGRGQPPRVRRRSHARWVHSTDFLVFVFLLVVVVVVFLTMPLRASRAHTKRVGDLPFEFEGGPSTDCRAGVPALVHHYAQIVKYSGCQSKETSSFAHMLRNNQARLIQRL